MMHHGQDGLRVGGRVGLELGHPLADGVEVASPNLVMVTV
jgi:hypothetical protein